MLKIMIKTLVVSVISVYILSILSCSVTQTPNYSEDDSISDETFEEETYEDTEDSGESKSENTNNSEPAVDSEVVDDDDESDDNVEETDEYFSVYSNNQRIGTLLGLYADLFYVVLTDTNYIIFINPETGYIYNIPVLYYSTEDCTGTFYSISDLINNVPFPGNIILSGKSSEKTKIYRLETNITTVNVRRYNNGLPSEVKCDYYGDDTTFEQLQEAIEIEQTETLKYRYDLPLTIVGNGNKHLRLYDGTGEELGPFISYFFYEGKSYIYDGNYFLPYNLASGNLLKRITYYDEGGCSGQPFLPNIYSYYLQISTLAMRDPINITQINVVDSSNLSLVALGSYYWGMECNSYGPSYPSNPLLMYNADDLNISIFNDGPLSISR